MDGKFRATQWFDPNTMTAWWGIWFVPKGKRRGMPVSTGSKPLFYNTKKEAKDMAKELNAGAPTEPSRV